MRWLGMISMVAATMLGSGVALAGGSTGGSSTGGSEDDTSGEPATGTTTEHGDTTDGSCGTCEAPGVPIVIASPADGAEVPAELTITVDANYACSCDDCGCYEDFPSSVTIAVDGAEIFACFDGCVGSFDAPTTLSPGTHQIVATAEYSFHSETATATVTVAGEGSGGSGSGEGSGGGSGGTSEDDSKSSCSCRTDDDRGRHDGVLGLALLLGLGAARRRRASFHA